MKANSNIQVLRGLAATGVHGWTDWRGLAWGLPATVIVGALALAPQVHRFLEVPVTRWPMNNIRPARRRPMSQATS